jgi:hypothetical protein
VVAALLIQCITPFPQGISILFLYSLPCKENRHQDVNHHDEWQRQRLKDENSHYGNGDENPPYLIAFPCQGLHLEREEPQVAYHHKRKQNRDAEASPKA